MEEIPDGGGQGHAGHQPDDGTDDDFIHAVAYAEEQQQGAAQRHQGAGGEVGQKLGHAMALYPAEVRLQRQAAEKGGEGVKAIPAEQIAEAGASNAAGQGGQGQGEIGGFLDLL